MLIRLVRLRPHSNQLHAIYTLGRQVQVAMQRNMRGGPCKDITKAMRPLAYRKLKGRRFYIQSYL